MKTKTKSAIVLLGVLLIGIIIGAVGSSMMRQSIWRDRIAKFRSPHGFAERLIEVIEPDPLQEKAIHEILLRHHEKMMSITEDSRKKVRTHADSLLIELETVLSPEQLERAKKVLSRGPRPFGPRKDRREKREEE